MAPTRLELQKTTENYSVFGFKTLVDRTYSRTNTEPKQATMTLDVRLCLLSQSSQNLSEPGVRCNGTAGLWRLGPSCGGTALGGSVRGRRIGRAGGWTAFAGPMLASPRGRMGDVMSPCYFPACAWTSWPLEGEVVRFDFSLLYFAYFGGIFLLHCEWPAVAVSDLRPSHGFPRVDCFHISPRVGTE